MRLSSNTHMPARKPVSFHALISEEAREIADIEARREGTSRSEIIDRALKDYAARRAAAVGAAQIAMPPARRGWLRLLGVPV